MFKLFNRNTATTQEDAVKNYDRLCSSVLGIAKTQGFRELVEWWGREYERLEVLIDKSVCEKEVFILSRERKIVKKHYLFMKNLVESSKSNEESF